MGLEKVINYVNTKVREDGLTVGEYYGTEYFSYLLYSLVRMERPKTVVELGTGLGATSCMIGQALKENKKGNLWTIDNGEDWKVLSQALGYTNPSHQDFFHKLLKELNLEKIVKFKNVTLTNESFFNPGKPIDMIFCDAHDNSAQGCITLLKYYLPLMSDYSSIFIDRSSTINHAHLMLEQLISYLQQGKIPACLRSKNLKSIAHLKFTLVHLAETKEAKKNRQQNSTAWIKIEPADVIIHNQVENYFK